MPIDTRGKPVELSRCRLALLPHDAHTRAEHAVYTALWNLAGPGEGEEDPYRDVSIGYDKLAALARASKRTVQRLVEILIEKLAIEAVAAENSAIRQGKTYRVYGTPEIERRRREAGYLWTWRDRSTVRLVKLTDTPEAAASLPADRADTPPSAEGEQQKTTPLASALDKIKSFMADDKAAAKLCDRCRWVDAEASDEEILYFLDLTIASLRRRSMVDDAWRDQLISEVPRRFTNPILIERYRLEHPR